MSHSLEIALLASYISQLFLGFLNWDTLPLSNVTYNLIHMVVNDPAPEGHNDTPASDQLFMSP